MRYRNEKHYRNETPFLIKKPIYEKLDRPRPKIKKLARSFYKGRKFRGKLSIPPPFLGIPLPLSEITRYLLLKYMSNNNIPAAS